MRRRAGCDCEQEGEQHGRRHHVWKGHRGERSGWAYGALSLSPTGQNKRCSSVRFNSKRFVLRKPSSRKC